MLLSGLWHGAGWTFILWGALHGAFMLLERGTGPARHAPAPLGRAIVLLAVFLAWVPFRAADIDATVASYRALAHGGWAWPSLGFLFGAAVLVVADVLRVPLATPAEAPPVFGWRAWAWLGRRALWPVSGIVVAFLVEVFWGASEKAFIYFRF
jgi:hypothetical protein